MARLTCPVILPLKVEWPLYAGMVEQEDTPDLKSVACKGVRVQIPLPAFGALAQLVEHLTVNQNVDGSIPSCPEDFI